MRAAATSVLITSTKGLARVLIHSGNGDLLLLLADTATAGKLWKRTTKEGPVLVLGPYLVRAAELRGNVLTLRGWLPAGLAWWYRTTFPDGENTLAIAVLGEDGASAGLGQIGLVPYGRYQGGVPVGLVDSPRWNAETWGQLGMPSNFAVGLTADHQNVFGGETLKVKATISNPADQPAEHIAVNLQAPAGWTVARDPTVEFLQIAPGQAVSIGWRVQIPISPKPGKYQMTAVADHRQGSEQEQTTADRADLEVPTPFYRGP
jgi:hypothetical protein